MIFVFVDTSDECHGYILKLYEVAVSPSKVKYFNAVLSDGKTEQSIVSYNTSLYEPLESAKLKDKPVRLINYMKIRDKFRNRETIKLGDRSCVEL